MSDLQCWSLAESEQDLSLSWADTRGRRCSAQLCSLLSDPVGPIIKPEEGKAPFAPNPQTDRESRVARSHAHWAHWALSHECVRAQVAAPVTAVRVELVVHMSSISRLQHTKLWVATHQCDRRICNDALLSFKPSKWTEWQWVDLLSLFDHYFRHTNMREINDSSPLVQWPPSPLLRWQTWICG